MGGGSEAKTSREGVFPEGACSQQCQVLLKDLEWPEPEQCPPRLVTWTVWRPQGASVKLGEGEQRPQGARLYKHEEEAGR